MGISHASATQRLATAPASADEEPAAIGAQRNRTSEAWDSVAAGFDEFTTPTNLALGVEAVRRVELRPGLRFLDVAAGSGALSIPAARLGAEVLATDISPAMVERLNARARSERLSNLEGRVMDGEALQLEDESFDVSGSQMGVMLFPDLPRGLSELARVTRRGGKVLVVAFGRPAKAEFLGFFVAAMKAAVPGFTGLPMDPPPLPFQVADPAVLSRKLVDAGLKDVRVETIDFGVEFRSGKHLWDWVRSSNPIGAAMVAGLTGEQAARVQQTADDMLRERSGGNGPAILNTEINIAIATR